MKEYQLEFDFIFRMMEREKMLSNIAKNLADELDRAFIEKVMADMASGKLKL